MTTYTIDLPSGIAPLTPNRRRHWRVYHRAVKGWRLSTFVAVTAAQVPPLGRCALTVEVTPPDRRRRDSDNLVPYLLKPIKDGLVDAGVIPDDTDAFCMWSVRLFEPDGDKTWKVRLTVVPLPASQQQGAA